VRVDIFVEIAANNLESPPMPFRMSRILRFWVEVECDEQNLRKADDRDIAAVLQEFEGRGDAMRSLNRRGQVVWKATPEMLDRLADAEAEVEADDRMGE
jgi:hypothetical protein